MYVRKGFFQIESIQTGPMFNVGKKIKKTYVSRMLQLTLQQYSIEVLVQMVATVVPLSQNQYNTAKDCLVIYLVQIVSVLRREKGYTVKYSTSPEELPETKGYIGPYILR